MLRGMDEIVDHPTPTGEAAAAIGPPFEDRRPPEPIDPAHAAIVERGREQGRRGQFAAAGDVEAVFRRAGL